MVFVIVCVLMIMGTLYDTALRYKILREIDKKDTSNNIVMESKFMIAEQLNHQVTLSKLWAVTTHIGSMGNLLHKFSLLYLNSGNRG